MDKEDVQRILDLMEEAVQRSERSQREIERALGLGQGYLSSLFSGRIELKVRHVYMLAKELGRDPLSFFLQASPPKDPRWLLEQIEASFEKTDLARSAGPVAQPPLTREEIEQLVRKTLREELARIGVEPPADEAG